MIKRETVDNYETFNNEIEEVMYFHLRAHKEVVLTGDFKNSEFNSSNNFFEAMISNGYNPKLVIPKRITDFSSTLIDNCYVKLS